MQAWFMSECPYPDVPADIVSAHRSARASLPNRLCDPLVAARLYDETIEEFLLCDSLGLNIVLNEHHAGMNCLHAAHAVLLGILARQTRRSRLLSLGTLITTRPDPVRVAEEFATADVISGGRLDIGFVKSGASEMASANANPIGIAERFWEAIDVIELALTSHDGPVRWEGRHFTHRHINIWPPPLQRPHPPFWAASADLPTTRELGRRGWINAVFAGGEARTRAAWDSYRAGAAEAGRPAPNEDRFAYLAFMAVADTDEEGQRLGEKLLWFLDVGDIVAPEFSTFLPGAVPQAAVPAAYRALGQPRAKADLAQAIARGMVFAGNPDAVHRQIMEFHARVGGFGHLVMMGRSGHMTHAETEKSIRLFAAEVMPRLTARAAFPAFR